MLDQPEDTLLQRAARQANQRRRSVYVYRDADDWKIAEKLADTQGSSQIIEVAYEGRQTETRNWGGC